MAANIYVYCPTSEDGLDRCDLEEELEAFFGEAAMECGAGGGEMGFNLDYELASSEDAQAWADRLGPFLTGLGVRPGSYFTVYPDGWEPGMAWRRVEVLGEDRWCVERPGPAGPA